VGRADDDDPPATVQLRVGEHPDQFAPGLPTIPTSRDSLTHLTPPAVPTPRYELGEEIARGGMGRVVEATDTRLGRVVALKEALALDAESLKRFERETQITARLEHPAIVPVHDAGAMSDGAPFYVMRKIGGRPLERLVATAESLNDRLALIPHVVASAHAVAHAHERGIIHRDIKPSNILCGELGETIVIDWGLAKVKGEPDEESGTANWVIEDDDQLKTRAGIVFGTPGFMAPEQLRGNAVNERTDVYALGATLYHLLSRKPPHHAKTADEMMRAAVRARPVPLAELVQGVPPELTTIVDKALAPDPKQRYQDARALAEDLQRFLTGQLVASHHYTPREKLARFVKKHRYTVVAIATALVALLVIGAIAVTRVIGERDRADVEARRAKQQQAAAEEAQRRAEDKNEKLVLQQARSKVISNPTEAVAMLKPLATRQWREVRSIAAAARANGVAWSLPAPRSVQTLELSRDGQRALVAGTDGSVQVYDLVARTSRVLVTHGPKLRARFADGGKKVVTWSGPTLTVLDANTGAPISVVAATTPIVDLEVVGVNAYWADAGKKLWQLDLAGKNPLEIATEEPIESISLSPDGRWIALVGDNHLLLHDRTQPAQPAQQVMFGKVRDLDWSDDGSHLGVLVELGEPTERVAADIAVNAGGQLVHRFRVGFREFLAWSQDRMFTIGPMGVGIVSRNETTPRKQMIGDPVGLRESINGAVIAASIGGLAVLTDDGDHTIALPEGRLQFLEASARSPYVVGLIEGRMLVWNLTEVLPRRLDTGVATLEAFTGNDRVLVAYQDAPAQWIDLTPPPGTARKPQLLGEFSAALLSIDGAPDGKAACVIDASHHVKLVVEGRAVEDLGSADLCVFAGNQAILGTASGTVVAVDLATKLRTPLVARTAQLVRLVASRGSGPAWIAAAFGDGTLWRVELATGKQATTPTGVVPKMIVLQPDGTVAYPEGRKLTVWRATNDVRPLVELPKPITAIGIAGSDRLLAYIEGGMGYLVRLDAPDRKSAPFDLAGVEAASQAPETGGLVFVNRGIIELYDPIAQHRWTLAGSPGLTFSHAKISNDGRHVLARRNITDREKVDVENREQKALLAWRLVIPPTPEETVSWLDQMTNAVVDPNTADLLWR
jgi:hypothetical protein